MPIKHREVWNFSNELVGTLAKKARGLMDSVTITCVESSAAKIESVDLVFFLEKKDLANMFPSCYVQY
jgi:hypothetical protein